jgi:molecular chaperone DnaK (HSP70)
VLSVSAAERRSGKRASLQVVPSHGLSRDEVERMERESFTHAREDMTRHRIADLVVNARLDAKWTRDAMARVESLLEPGYRARLDALLADLSTAADRAAADWRTADADALQRLKESLDRQSVRLHEVAITESLRHGASS